MVQWYLKSFYFQDQCAESQQHPQQRRNGLPQRQQHRRDHALHLLREGAPQKGEGRLNCFIFIIKWIDWLIDWLLTDWLTDWLTGWLTDWLTDWQMNEKNKTNIFFLFSNAHWILALMLCSRNLTKLVHAMFVKFQLRSMSFKIERAVEITHKILHWNGAKKDISYETLRNIDRCKVAKRQKKHIFFVRMFSFIL